MRIRQLTEQDALAVQGLVQTVVQSQGLKAEFYWTPEMILDELSTTEGVGIFKGSQLAGVILYRVLPMAWEISLVATHPQFQRRGLMEILIRHLSDACRQGNSEERELWLEVHERNQGAQNLYEKLGFRQIGQRNRYYKDGGTALLYSWP
jgi:ribosomal-protein-alanine N-acetyltransferase